MEENQRGSRALYVQPPALALASASSEFFPKEPLNRSSNPITSWILVWRKSQTFRFHLTNDLAQLSSEFGLLVNKKVVEL